MKCPTGPLLGYEPESELCRFLFEQAMTSCHKREDLERPEQHTNNYTTIIPYRDTAECIVYNGKFSIGRQELLSASLNNVIFGSSAMDQNFHNAGHPLCQ